MFKKRLGIQPKIRTMDEINRDYNHHAGNVGHKQRLIEDLEVEIEGHKQRLREIDDEAKRLPKEAKTSPETSPPIDTTPKGAA